MLSRLLERNESHVRKLPEGYFDDVQEGQEPAAVSVCCSDSRVPQEGMWDVDKPGWLFTPSTIGNQVWDVYDGEKVVDGSVLYPMEFTDTKVTLIVGHTGCGAVSAALEAVRNEEDEGNEAPAGVANWVENLIPVVKESLEDGGGGEKDISEGITKWVESLVPVVEEGLEDERVSNDREASLVDQLVEYNVDAQVEFLLGSNEVPDDETVYGFVYDFQGIYGDERGRAYLVNADGETDEDALRDLVPDRHEGAVRRLL